MTNDELLLKINEKMKDNINLLLDSAGMADFNKCIMFSDDLQVWLKYCGEFSELKLVKEAQTECINSLVLCAQGLYKEAIVTLRQFLEHILFSVLLSTNDYRYRLWREGKYDLSWAQITEEQCGVFGKDFLRLYAPDVDESRSMELNTIAKNVYRECSEFVHGNYVKLSFLFENVAYNQSALNDYITYFDSIRYVVCMSLFIRFRNVFEDPQNIVALESIVVDNIGTLGEVQQIFERGREEYHE